MYVHDTGSAKFYFFQLFYKLYISVLMKPKRRWHVLRHFFIATRLNIEIIFWVLSPLTRVPVPSTRVLSQQLRVLTQTTRVPTPSSWVLSPLTRKRSQTTRVLVPSMRVLAPLTRTRSQTFCTLSQTTRVLSKAMPRFLVVYSGKIHLPRIGQFTS